MCAAFIRLRYILFHRLGTLVICVLELTVFLGRQGYIAGTETVMVQEDDTGMVRRNIPDDMLKR